MFCYRNHLLRLFRRRVKPTELRQWKSKKCLGSTGIFVEDAHIQMTLRAAALPQPSVRKTLSTFIKLSEQTDDKLLTILFVKIIYHIVPKMLSPWAERSSSVNGYRSHQNGRCRWALPVKKFEWRWDTVLSLQSSYITSISWMEYDVSKEENILLGHKQGKGDAGGVIFFFLMIYLCFIKVSFTDPEGQTVWTKHFMCKFSATYKTLSEGDIQKYGQNTIVFFLHDNTAAHRLLLVQNYLAKNNTIALQHSPYLPDMYQLTSTCSLKRDNILLIQRTLPEMQQDSSRNFIKKTLEECFQQLYNHLGKCVNANREYFEGVVVWML